MANKMLIDSTHPEETRVVVLRGNRVEEFDFESANRRQLRGNIYLAKVTRVEPSLQAAFVDYGGNRHGFLAFSEIHPDYYQIPVADRQALIAEEERAHRDAEAEIDRRASRRWPRRGEAASERHDATRTQRLEEGSEVPAEPSDATPHAGEPDIPAEQRHDEPVPTAAHADKPHGEGAQNAAESGMAEPPPETPSQADIPAPAAEAARRCIAAAPCRAASAAVSSRDETGPRSHGRSTPRRRARA